MFALPARKKQQAMGKVLLRSHGKEFQKKSLNYLVLEMGLGTIRSVLLARHSKAGLTNLEDYESVNRRSKKIIGKEMFFQRNC